MKPGVTNILKIQKCSCALWPCDRVWEAFAKIQSGLFEDAWTSSFPRRGQVSGLQDRPHQLKPSLTYPTSPSFTSKGLLEGVAGLPGDGHSLNSRYYYSH